MFSLRFKCFPLHECFPLHTQAINIWLDKASVSMKTYFGQFGRSIDKLYAARLSTSTFLNDILLCGEAWAQSQGHCHGLCSEQTTNIRQREFDAADNEFHTNVDTFLRTHTHKLRFYHFHCSNEQNRKNITPCNVYYKACAFHHCRHFTQSVECYCVHCAIAPAALIFPLGSKFIWQFAGWN